MTPTTEVIWVCMDYDGSPPQVARTHAGQPEATTHTRSDDVAEVAGVSRPSPWWSSVLRSITGQRPVVARTRTAGSAEISRPMNVETVRTRRNY